MNDTTTPRPWKHAVACLGTAALVAAAVASGSSAGAASNSLLGTARNFAVLAGTEITNVPTSGATVITGDIGSTTQTIPNVVLIPPSINHGNSGDTPAARAGLTTAYVEAANAGPATLIPTELGGTTREAGVYYTDSGELGLTGTVPLILRGDADDVFIFQARASTLITGAGSSVELDGVSPCNVFWQVGSSATFGSNSVFAGTVMALTAITAEQGATFNGRLLARNAEVTLNNNTITRPLCAEDEDDADDTDGGEDTDGADDTVGGDDDTDGADDTVGGDDTDGAVADGDGGLGDDTDTDGVSGADADGGSAGDADGTDADGGGGAGTDGGTSTSASPPDSWLPSAGGPSAVLLTLAGLAALGGALMLVVRRRVPRQH